MKTAIVLCGNLRTFFMPMRENNIPVCDMFMTNIAKNNNADIFLVTDTNDFYYNDAQYFTTNKRIDLLYHETYRLHDKIEFIDDISAKNILATELSKLGNNVKYISIESPYDATKDLKFDLLNNANVMGSNPLFLINQYRKLKIAYDALEKYEKDNNFSYDVIIKWRFDINSDTLLDLSKYDFINNDLYVAGLHTPIIYDWHAFGKRESMKLFLNTYSYLGNFLNQGRVYLCDKCRYYGKDKKCACNNEKAFSEITLSSEYHLFKIFQLNNIKLANSGYSASPYRYKEMTFKLPVEEFMKKLNITATVVNYNSGTKTSEETYTKNE